MDPAQFQIGILLFVVLVVSLSVHEAAHALVAFWLGDSTARDEGRLSLNPLRHLDPTGTVMMAFMALGGTGIGWAKPVPVNPLRLRNRLRAMGLIAAAGPLSNIIQAWLGLIVLRWVSGDSTPAQVVQIFQIFIGVNLSLAAFNLLPVYPLDGQKVLSSLLPAPLARQLDFFSVRSGLWPLLFLLIWEWVLPWPGPLSWVLGPLRGALAAALQASTDWIR